MFIVYAHAKFLNVKSFFPLVTCTSLIETFIEFNLKKRGQIQQNFTNRELQVTRGKNDLTLRNLAWAYAINIAKQGSTSYNSTLTKSIL